jgi:hypothetical protein
LIIETGDTTVNPTYDLASLSFHENVRPFVEAPITVSSIAVGFA